MALAFLFFSAPALRSRTSRFVSTPKDHRRFPAFFQRARAAFRPISDNSFFEAFLARALPPLRPSSTITECSTAAGIVFFIASQA